MKSKTAVKVSTIAALLVMGAVQVSADDAANIGKQLTAKYGSAIVKAQLVAQMRVSYDGREGQKQESKTETTATIIDPSGLAVVSLSATSPAETYRSMMDEGMDIQSQVTDVKLRMSDGTETPAKIVLRDKDLDLAFIRPAQKPAQPMPYVDLTQAAKPECLDEIFVLCRLGKVANRALSVCLDRIQATVDKPRTFYIPGFASMTSDMGAPVFNLEGKAVGILILRSSPGGGDDGGLGVGSMGMLPMILPAADIQKVAKQAPENEAKTATAPAPAKADSSEKPAAKPAAAKPKK
jgi:S1-C subfamily serine protease